MRHALRLLLLTTVALSWGCASYSRASGGQSWIAPADAARLGYRAAWPASLRIEHSQRFADAAILGDAVVTIETPGRVVSAVSLRDGALLWRTAVGTTAQRLVGLTMMNGRVAVNTETQLFLLDPDSGQVLAIQDLGRPVGSRPVPFHQLLIFGSVTGVVFAHNVSNGLSAWEYQLANKIQVTPVLTGGTVFASDISGTYVMLGASDGELAWRGRTFGAIVAAAAADSNAVYLPSTDQALYALARTSGRDRWQPYRADRSLIDPPHVLGNTIYLPIPDTALVALDAANGNVLWRLDRDAWAVDARGNDLILRTPDGLLIADAATGAVQTQVRVRDLEFVLPTPDGSLVLVSRGGRLLRLDPLQ